MSKIYALWDEIESKVKESNDNTSKIINILKTTDLDLFIQCTYDGMLSIIWHENTNRKFDFKFDVEGFDVHIRKIESLDKTKDVIEIENTKIENNNIFKAFTASLYDNIVTNNSMDIEEIIYSTVEDYRTFFSGIKKDLSINEQQGLFGELMFMNEILEQKDNVINAWEGPNKSKHDFVFEDCSYEIKSTKNQMRLDILINNECQLDNTKVNKLKLVVYRLEKVDTGRTIYDLYNEIKNKLNVVDKKNFDIKIYQSGMNLEDNINYKKFKVIDRLIYDITDEFPKLTQANFSDKIFEVKYHINLDGLAADKKEYTNE